jgi:hypothetical protein
MADRSDRCSLQATITANGVAWSSTMYERTEVFVVRPRFQPPLVEQAMVGVSRKTGTELRFTPRVPLKPGEPVRLLAKTAEGRFSCNATAMSGTPGHVWFDIGHWSRLELREAERVPVQLPGVIRADGSREISATIENISLGGFLASCDVVPRSKEIMLLVVGDDSSDDFPCRVVDLRRRDGKYFLHLALDTGSDAIVRRLSELFEIQFAASDLAHPESEQAAA